MTSDQIRAQFIDFFVTRHGHTFVPSSPVVPLDDPTLMFTNAGMNQFKPIFLGQEKREYVRAVNTQKCIRAGGKHNDLDDVGRSRRHQTFFEMLGNWSFGDYFKRGAIEMSWELLTVVWKLDPSRIHVTCYRGDEAAGIPRDTEAADLWKQIAKLPDDHIHFLGKENFWEMGETGPCGPCTEIFIDRTPDKTGGPSVERDDDPRVMEFWNNVFIQYNRDASGKLTPLPAQHVDTGMGLERICQILQGKEDNFAIDLWAPLFGLIGKLSGLTYGGRFPRSNVADPVAEAADEQLRHDIAFRVVADHVRCLTFALTDGAVPSNEGRGYVLRRILRRAVRFGRQQLGLTEPFMHRLVPVVVDSMAGAFPELRKNPAHVAQLIEEEEVSFSKTLDRGIALFEEARRAAVNQTIGADHAFRLHDTYGFPIDLTRIMAEERGLRVDISGFEQLMEQARNLARSGGKAASSKIGELPPPALGRLGELGIGPTEDRFKYAHEPVAAKVVAIWDGEQLLTEPGSSSSSADLAVILDRTNFYAEMGGQVGDHGELRGSVVFDVESARPSGGFVLHVGRTRSGPLRVGDGVTAVVGAERAPTEMNHTTTHLANWALREVLGDGVQQKGSLVDAEKLRFDFSHPKALSDDETAKVESLVRAAIGKGLRVYWSEVPQAAALKINGLRAVFGEKYPPMVRVVSIGVPVEDLLAEPANPRWREYSVEFCGGTHLPNSNVAGEFVVTGEESVSKGIRRIVGLTGESARAASTAAAEAQSLVQQAAGRGDGELVSLIRELQESLTRTMPLRARRLVQAAVAHLQARAKAWEKSQRASSPVAGGADPVATSGRLLESAADLAGAKLIVGELAGASDQQLRAAVDSLKKKAGSFAILLAASDGQKISFVAAVSDDVIARGLAAGDWVRQAAQAAGGGGGGRPQMAQAGGKDPSKMNDALEVARAFARATVH
jgi:alanyl-tRNA synthetase